MDEALLLPVAVPGGHSRRELLSQKWPPPHSEHTTGVGVAVENEPLPNNVYQSPDVALGLQATAASPLTW